MSPVYHVEIAGFAAGAESKWLDNLLSHFEIPGVESGRQGVARRISPEAVHQIALIRLLTRELGVDVPRAVELSGRLLADEHGRVALPAGLDIRLDRATFKREIDRAIAEAVEWVAPRRRGRPPRRSPAAG